MAENDEKNREPNGWESVIKILQTFLPAIGVFTALIYLLGRLYIESYYYALGISPDVLVFTTDDYMFFSFNMIVMCLVFTGLFYLYWEWFISEESTGKTPFPVLENRRTIMVPVIALICFLSILYYMFFHIYPEIYITGISGLCVGLVYGIGLIMVIIVIHMLSGQTSKKSFIIQSLISVIIVFSLMPLITADLAQAQADNDEMRYPDVRIITATPVHSEIIKSSSGQVDYLDGQLLLTNNGISYVMKMFKVPRGTDYRTVKFAIDSPEISLTSSEIKSISGNFAIYRQVYAVPVENIENIIYYTKK